METDADTLVHQLHLTANDLLGTLVTCWTTRIQLFKFDREHVIGKMYGGPDGLLWWRCQVGEPKLDEEDDVVETIEASICGIKG